MGAVVRLWCPAEAALREHANDSGWARQKLAEALELLQDLPKYHREGIVELVRRAGGSAKRAISILKALSRPSDDERLALLEAAETDVALALRQLGVLG
jgi:hypothetical protein